MNLIVYITHVESARFLKTQTYSEIPT